MKTLNKLGLLISGFTLALPAAAFAQDVPADPDGANEGVAEPAQAEPLSPPNDGDLPAPKSDDDPLPEVATPGVPSGGIVKQAGVGGDTGYGRAGVLELGGSASFRAGSGFTQASIAPSVGWFLADNFQISGMFDLGYVEQDDNSAMLTSLLVEPSYHIPFNRSVFGFLGIGLGAAHVEDLGLGFATAPRVGMNVLVGRSGILTPSLSWQYTTHDTDTMEGAPADTATLAVSSAARFNIGYTVMW
jgi:hypothetical protein